MEEDMRLKDQVAIVTGAGRNIGEDICKLFVQEGAKVAVVDLDPGRGSRVAGEINAAQPGKAISLSAMCPRQARWRTWFSKR
jgi:NAD(P)-dependent dehydrogenase (short-subunit alcohol dehydrogenase family)